MSEQGTLEWQRMRLGKFSGSNIHKLMGKARNKSDIFSQTALTYIKEVAAERCLNQKMVDDDGDLAYMSTTPKHQAEQSHGGRCTSL